MTAHAYLPGPLHPDLFAPDPTPTTIPASAGEPRWRAEILCIRHVVADRSLAEFPWPDQLRQDIDELSRECGAADRWEVLGSTATDGCTPVRILQVGLIHHLEVAAGDSHEALEIAQAIAAQRWPGAEVLGVDLVYPEEEARA